MTTLAVVNAKVWTGSRGQTAEAIAVDGDRLTAVGSNAEIGALLTARTRVLDARGRLLLPGFNDAHVHFLAGGDALAAADLRAAPDERAFAAAVARRAAGLPPGTWIRSGQWDHEAWPGQRRPTRGLLDAAAPRHPVFLRRIDGHMGVANSLALNLAGITRASTDPAGGTIERDPVSREPTGILVDAAMDQITRHIPEPTPEERFQAAMAATRHAAALGVTSVQYSGGMEEFQALQDLERRGALATRVYMLLPPAERHWLPNQAAAPTEPQPMVRLGAVKLFADGSLGARSALFFEPYEDAPETCGLAMQSEEELCRRVADIDAAGQQVALHAIGDRAVHWALNAFERAAQANGRRDARHRVEHAQAVRPEDRVRFARLGVIASIQPYHCIDDMRWVERRLGGRCVNAYPYQSLARAGTRLALGTDWPVEPLDPMLALYAAVTREFPSGGPSGGWYPGERVRLEQALADHTQGSAFAEFADHRKGTLCPGQLADFALLSEDILALPPRQLLETRVVATVVGGQVVYEA